MNAATALAEPTAAERRAQERERLVNELLEVVDDYLLSHRFHVHECIAGTWVAIPGSLDYDDARAWAARLRDQGRTVAVAPVQGCALATDH